MALLSGCVCVLHARVGQLEPLAAAAAGHGAKVRRSSAPASPLDVLFTSTVPHLAAGFLLLQPARGAEEEAARVEAAERSFKKTLYVLHTSADDFAAAALSAAARVDSHASWLSLPRGANTVLFVLDVVCGIMAALSGGGDPAALPPPPPEEAADAVLAALTALGLPAVAADAACARPPEPACACIRLHALRLRPARRCCARSARWRTWRRRG